MKKDKICVLIPPAIGLTTRLALDEFQNSLRKAGISCRTIDSGECGKNEVAVALELDPDFLMALLPLASIRATSSDPALRDGQEAIELATRACELTGHQAPTPLVALSEAYAEVGRFPDALSVARRALRIARQAGNESLVNAIRQRIEFYERREPPRQSHSR